MGPYGADARYGGTWTPYKFDINLQRQKCTSFRLEIEDEQTENFNEGFTLSNVSIQFGRKNTMNKGYGNNRSGTS
jgi:hypothetical protein